MIDACGPMRIKKIGLRPMNIKNRGEYFNEKGQGKSPFPP
jgi:hypothetical protein